MSTMILTYSNRSKIYAAKNIRCRIRS